MMRNFAVKFAILINRRTGLTGEEPAHRLPPVTPQDLLDLHPRQMLERYKQYLPLREQGRLYFGLGDQAIIDILDVDFEVDMDRNTLVFRKTYLDAMSVRLAAGQGEAPYILADADAEALVHHLSNWLYDASRGLYRDKPDEVRIEDIRQEYGVCLRRYAERQVIIGQDDTPAEALHGLIVSVRQMKAFLHSLTVDAMFKMDAAEVLFGAQSGYHQVWMRKQIFRHMVAQCVESYIIKSAA